MLKVDEMEIVRLYIDEGLTGPEVGQRVGLGPTAVYRVLHRNGISAQDRRWQQHYASLGTSREEIVEAYEAGASMEELALKYGVERITVRNLLLRFGVKPRRAGQRLKPATPDQRVQIIALREQGMRLQDIAYSIGRGLLCVKQVLEPLGMTGHLPPRRQPRVNSQGYVRVWIAPDDPLRSMAFSRAPGWIAEHRLVMARHLGRPLTQAETIHHINGNPGDNRIENLQLRQGQHGKGARFTCADCGSHNVVAHPI